MHIHAFLVLSTLEKSTESDFYALLQATKQLVDMKLIKSTAGTHGISRSTLQCYLKKFESKFADISAVDDSVFMDFVRECNQ